MAVLRLGRFGTGLVGTREMLTSHAALAAAVSPAKSTRPDTRRPSMRDRLRPVPGEDVTNACGGRDVHRRVWPAPPPPQPRHGTGRAPTARRGGEQA